MSRLLWFSCRDRCSFFYLLLLSSFRAFAPVPLHPAPPSHSTHLPPSTSSLFTYFSTPVFTFHASTLNPLPSETPNPNFYSEHFNLYPSYPDLCSCETKRILTLTLTLPTGVLPFIHKSLTAAQKGKKAQPVEGAQ